MQGDESRDAEVFSEGRGNISTQGRIASLRREDKPSKEKLLSQIKARKIRTRHLIEMGGLVVKAEMDHLSSDVLLGALIYAKEQMALHGNLQEAYSKLGEIAFNRYKRGKIKVILRFKEEPDVYIRQKIREIGMKWSFKAKEWHGEVEGLGVLKETVQGLDCNLKTLS